MRAIYSWIITNIAYHPEEYKKFDYTFKNFRERNQKEEKTRSKIIARTLQNGIAVCEGYAFVFEKLCNDLGIENYLIQGDTKTHFIDIGRDFNKNHVWNAAKIQDHWYLFDVTWGAGKYQGKFIKEPSYYYYKITPAHLIKTHYPAMAEDTFLNQIPSRETFFSAPIVIEKSLDFSAIITPQQGILSATEASGVLDFKIKTETQKKVTYTFMQQQKSIDSRYEAGVLSFSIPIELGVNQLLIYFDEQPALAYKIQ